MTRRAIVAGLFGVALVAVLSIRGGGDTTRRDAEATQGNPWTGPRGVSVKVATIMSRPDHTPRTQEELSSSNEPEAEAEGGESEAEAGGGESDSAVEAAEPAGGPVLEKPEPGEGSSTPRRAADGVPLEREGQSATAPQSELTQPATPFSFLGGDGCALPQPCDSHFVPPDSMGAVGPDQIVVSLNGMIRVFDKDGNEEALSGITDSQFWADVLPAGVQPTDPGVEFDRFSNRWILSAIDIEPTNNRLLLAVSDGPHISSTSSFNLYFFNQNSPNPGPTAHFADYPQLGVDANAIYIGVNEFTSSSGSFTGTTAYVINKASVPGPPAAAGAPVVTAFRNLAATSTAGPVSPQPATTMDPAVSAGYIIGPDNQFFSRLDIRRITFPAGIPSITGNLVVAVPATTLPPGAFSVPALGTTGGLDALDDRLFEAMIARGPGGEDTLWTAHNIPVDASGQASALGNRVGARWYQIGSLDSNPPSLIQPGTLFDPTAVNPRSFWIPSIAMNGQGHAYLNSSTAGVGRRAEVASAGRLVDEPDGTLEPFQVTQSSSFAYNLGSDSPKRWGDYSQTVVDPTDNMTFWTFQEYASGTNQWGVRVIRLQAPPPADLSTASPATVAQGQCAVGVQVTGTSTAGSGFFDPGPDPGGPGYANHIDASITGGVAVNRVTYVDPTHLTLNLDTTGASIGSQDLTITNPDGQSITSTGFITVDPAGSGPTPPCMDGTTPASPSTSITPKVFGRADPGSDVSIYTDPDCTGSVVGTGTASDFASSGPGIAVDPVTEGIPTTYYATATSGMVTSVCSSTLPAPTDSVTYVADSTDPIVAVNTGPSGLTNNNTPTFSFSASDAISPVTFECSIDAGTASFRVCSGPGNSDTPLSPNRPLADGSYTFRVQATDAAGNSALDTRSFTVDATPPAVAVNGGPTGATNSQTPTFTFSATDAHGPITFQCSIDAGTPAFGGCSGPGNSDTPSSPLAFGSYTFRVRGTDAATNSSVATRSFSVKGPPETTITKGPKKTRKPRPKFKFTASEAGTSFQCQVDRRAFVPCTSPFRPPKLKPGKHVLRVKAIDSLGNVDSTPAVKKFRILPPA